MLTWKRVGWINKRNNRNRRRTLGHNFIDMSHLRRNQRSTIADDRSIRILDKFPCHNCQVNAQLLNNLQHLSSCSFNKRNAIAISLPTACLLAKEWHDFCRKECILKLWYCLKMFPQRLIWDLQRPLSVGLLGVLWHWHCCTLDTKYTETPH